MDQALASKKVLVVDDNADAAFILAELLTMRGHVVQVAIGGPEGFDAATESQPDVVLLDIGMPAMNGYQVAAALRENASTKKIRLIAMTAWGDIDSKALAIRCGFDIHLVIPAEFGALFSAIELGGR